MTNEEYDRLTPVEKQDWHRAHPNDKLEGRSKHEKLIDLEHIRLLLDIEERTRAHGTQYAAIRTHVVNELKDIHAGFEHANAQVLVAKKKVDDEKAHHAAVAQRENLAKTQAAQDEEVARRVVAKEAALQTAPLPEVAPTTVPGPSPSEPGVPIYPPQSGIVQSDVAPGILDRPASETMDRRI